MLSWNQPEKRKFIKIKSHLKNKELSFDANVENLIEKVLAARNLMPPADIRQLRDLTRCRFKPTCMIIGEKNRVQRRKIYMENKAFCYDDIINLTRPVFCIASPLWTGTGAPHNPLLLPLFPDMKML